MPKALMVAASAAFVAGASLVTLPAPPAFKPKPQTSGAIDCRREPAKCPHAEAYTPQQAASVETSVIACRPSAPSTAPGQAVALQP